MNALHAGLSTAEREARSLHDGLARPFRDVSARLLTSRPVCVPLSGRNGGGSMNRRSLLSTLRTVTAIGGIGAFAAGSALAGEGNVPSGVPHLDHVFFIMMENHAYDQIV